MPGPLVGSARGGRGGPRPPTESMPKYRSALPQLSEHLFLMDGGLETTLIFHEGFELPAFAAFVLLDEDEGKQALWSYFHTYVGIAREHGVGIVLDTPTWRANEAWGRKLERTPEELADANRRAIELLVELRDRAETPASPIVICGCIGPAADGYVPSAAMSAAEAERFHATQVRTLADTDADLVAALTMIHTDEAIGVARAAAAIDMPVVISFTVETDGRLPSGLALADAIRQVDEATDTAPAYYMINCAHPTHFADVLDPAAPWTKRIRGVRANASALSHAELDECTELDDGDPALFGRQCAELRARLPHVNMLGGCCGTDHRHIGEIALACLEIED